MTDTCSEELSKYFEDILKNKELIIEMINTNILMYEDKIKTNKEKISQIKDHQEKVSAEFSISETRLKSEFSKYHEQYQKHEINYKLLDRTSSHYKSLIREREDEIRKLEEQSIYCYQDYQNKKVKLDCLNVQIVEADFQLKNFQRLMDEKINCLVNSKKSEENQNTFQNISLDNNNSNQTITNTVNLKERPYLNNESSTVIVESAPKIRKSKNNIFWEPITEKEETLLSSYKHLTVNSENINIKKRCILF